MHRLIAHRLKALNVSGAYNGFALRLECKLHHDHIAIATQINEIAERNGFGAIARIPAENIIELNTSAFLYEKSAHQISGSELIGKIFDSINESLRVRKNNIEPIFKAGFAPGTKNRVATTTVARAA